MTPNLPALLPLLIPLLFIVGALTSRSRWRWPVAEAVSAAAFALTIGGAAMAVLGGPATPAAAEPVNLVMAVLVTFMAFAIVRYSKRYLAGEPHQATYTGMLQITLAAVSTVVLTDHLLVLLAAWVVISLSLHRLLLFYPHRPRAALAAHKKFLFARTAEVLLLGAVALLYTQHGTWLIDDIVAASVERGASTADRMAALLLAATALIKCAQMPMHGWLIQVVEAPTPVSALLHAGIVNLGGYLLIRFAPLFADATAAQWLVLVVGGLTTVVAALVMTTRISIKVKLAWSTCAQMGLMLVECALGLYQLALLHLLAHACYKAYGFLAAGSAVQEHVTRLQAPAAAPDARGWLLATLPVLPVALAPALLPGLEGPFGPWLLLAATLAVLLAERSSTRHRRPLTAAVGVGLLLTGAYLLQTRVAALLIAPLPASAGWPADAWVCLLATALLIGHLVLRLRPAGVPVQRLSAWLFAGLYLDEWVTRTTLRLWPITLPTTRPPSASTLAEETHA